MNMVEKKIYSISPGYLPHFKSMFKKYVQFGGGADSQRYVKGRYFSNVYEVFGAVCFFCLSCLFCSRLNPFGDRNDVQSHRN